MRRCSIDVVKISREVISLFIEVHGTTARYEDTQPRYYSERSFSRRGCDVVPTLKSETVDHDAGAAGQFRR